MPTLKRPEPKEFKTVYLACRITQRVYDRLEEAAKEASMPVSTLAAFAIEQYLEFLATSEKPAKKKARRKR